MSDEQPDYTHESLDEPTLVMDRKVLLLILAGMAGLALTLALLRARMAKPVSPSLGQVPMDEGADWRVSMQHLAANFDIRFAGLDQRLDELVADKVARTATAAYSMPPETLSDTNGTPTVERIPPVVHTGPESAPPPPAAVSMPPGMSE